MVRHFYMVCPLFIVLPLYLFLQILRQHNKKRTVSSEDPPSIGKCPDKDRASIRICQAKDLASVRKYPIKLGQTFYYIWGIKAVHFFTDGDSESGIFLRIRILNGTLARHIITDEGSKQYIFLRVRILSRTFSRR